MVVSDVIIVGGGPVGLYALYHAGKKSMTAKLIDALPEPGGQLTNLYPENDIRDIAGHFLVKAKKLVQNLKKQAFRHDATICCGERVTGIQFREGLFDVTTDKQQHQSKSVVLAIGPGAFVSSSIFDQPQDVQEKAGLFTELKNVSALTNKHVLICGGREEAIGWAVEVNTVAKSVTTVSCHDIYKMESQKLEPALSMVDVLIPYDLLEIHGTERVTAATIIHNLTRETTRLKIDAVLMARGQLTNLEHVSSWGVIFDHNSIEVGRKMQTSLPGVFAAGDIVAYPGKIKNISTGANEAAIAINSAKTYLNKI